MSTDRLLFRFERSMELGVGEKQLLTQLCTQLGFPREDTFLQVHGPLRLRLTGRHVA